MDSLELSQDQFSSRYFCKLDTQMSTAYLIIPNSTCKEEMQRQPTKPISALLHGGFPESKAQNMIKG